MRIVAAQALTLQADRTRAREEEGKVTIVHQYNVTRRLLPEDKRDASARCIAACIIRACGMTGGNATERDLRATVTVSHRAELYVRWRECQSRR